MFSELVGAVWRTSTRSVEFGHCVEVADNLQGAVGVRDSKDRQGPELTFSPQSWIAFVGSLKPRV